MRKGINSKIKETLEFIKSNPGCNSNTLDVRIVHELVYDGFAEGFDIFSQSTTLQVEAGHEYQELSITSNGERFLESLSDTSASSLWRIEKLWIPLMISLFGIALVYFLNKH